MKRYMVTWADGFGWYVFDSLAAAHNKLSELLAWNPGNGAFVKVSDGRGGWVRS